MVCFKISAPGRIILSGEHIAAYGKQFLATSLNLRTTLEFCELPNEPKSNIRIELDNINLKRDISFEDVIRFFLCSDVENIISNSLNLHAYVRHWATVKRMWTTHQELFSLQILFFLLYSIRHCEHLTIRPFCIKVWTELPLCGGLGSSTSFAVCLAGCFLHWQRLQSGCNHIEFNNAELESIVKYTMSCEKSMLDYTFAEVDAHVCTYGRIVKCQRSDYQIFKIDPTDMAEMKILLINTNFHLNKYIRAEQMATLNATTVDFHSILLELEIMALKMYQNLESLSKIIRQGHLFKIPREYNSTISQMMLCINVNQQLLNKLHLSAEAFENVCTIARTYNLAGKLTGFGGNYVFVLIPPNVIDEQISNFTHQLSANGFNIQIRTIINCGRVRIH
ncbi:mevalonate kinase-like [Nylanderia fulva]|uniref:mevalonate kinase-like n=1 Tax=Nylanderia fulva TaxID=613905 RepID=UPI0010FB0838|nr:mevalonate kinase-like [Nylanderia fulva]XP_029178953.1 mevalonate kinase-like [Nylanderia fulva]